jgi:competence ComEA-like helix-hairpin-helix protein
MISCFLLLGCGRVEHASPETSQIITSESAININTASTEELEKLPHIGEKLAAKIVEHREKFGNFRKPEHLMLVRGISDERFRTMRNSIKVED